MIQPLMRKTDSGRTTVGHPPDSGRTTVGHIQECIRMLRMHKHLFCYEEKRNARVREAAIAEVIRNMTQAGCGMPHFAVSSPCLDCVERHPACHDACSRYAEYQVTLKRIRDEKKRQQNNRYTRTDKQAQVKSSAIARKNARRKKNDER